MRSGAVVLHAVIALVVGPDSGLAQTADLRYRVTDPLQLYYVSTDTARTEMQGLPTGPVTSRMNMRLTYAVEMSSAGDSVRVRVATDSAAGTVEVMGQTQHIGTELMGSPSEFVVGPTGLHDAVLRMGEIDMQSSMSTGLGQAAASNLLLLLPGREVRVGGTWSDTLTHAGSVSGMEIDAVTIIRGSYASDTTVAGTTYKQLRYVSESNMTSAGNMQGMNMKQTMTGERTETVLWDPVRRIVVERRHTTAMTMNMEVPMAPGTMVMNVNSSGSVRLTERSRD
jgi:hypothetical protein